MTFNNYIRLQQEIPVTIAGKKCVICAHERPKVLLIQPLGEHENATLYAEIKTISESVHLPFVFVGFEISEWEKELMPWADSFVANDREVGLHAGDTLNYLKHSLIPYLHNEYNHLPVILGGYSLAGLFALWAASQSDLFDSVAACSPSLWINNWNEYAQSFPLCVRTVYLSLGDKEEATCNQRLSVVGNRVRSEYDLLRRHLGEDHCTLVWEQGGHFVTPHLRLARAFTWCINSTFLSIPLHM